MSCGLLKAFKLISLDSRIALESAWNRPTTTSYSSLNRGIWVCSLRNSLTASKYPLKVAQSDCRTSGSYALKEKVTKAFTGADCLLRSRLSDRKSLGFRGVLSEEPVLD